jgi:hypothetical protein
MGGHELRGQVKVCNRKMLHNLQTLCKRRPASWQQMYSGSARDQKNSHEAETITTEVPQQMKKLKCVC